MIEEHGRGLRLLVKQMTDRAFQIVISVVTTLLAIVGLLFSVGEYQIWALGLVFVVSLAMLLYVVLNISAVTSVAIRHQTYSSRQIQVLNRRVSAKNDELLDYKRHIGVSDKAFRELAINRTALDERIFKIAMESSSDGDARLDDIVEVFLRSVCDTAVDVYSARHKVERDEISASIKIIGKSDDHYYYTTAARSANVSENRDDNDDEKYPVLSNANYFDAMRDKDRANIIVDLATYIELYQSRGNEELCAPPARALDFYKSAITVLLFLKPRSQRKLVLGTYGENAFKTQRGDLVYGFLTIDSPSVTFSRLDLDIVYELSIHALSAVRFKDFVDIIKESKALSE